MKIKKIDVAEDFSDVPYGRYPEDGPDNGQTFRENLLLPALRECDEVHLYLDGAMGYGSSFLDEVFGGLYRNNGLSKEDIKKKLKIHTKLSFIEETIWTYIAKAKREN